MDNDELTNDDEIKTPQTQPAAPQADDAEEEQENPAERFVVEASAGSGDHVEVLMTPVGLLTVVCDGMGTAGQEAARIGAQAIAAEIAKSRAARDVPAALNHSMRVAHRAILEYVEHTPGATGSGASVACLLLSADKAVAAWLGDTRIYQLRRRTVEFRSKDHSKVVELMEAGVITEEEARQSEEANILTKSLGHGRDHQPRMVQLPYLKGDRFVICTPGVWRTMRTRELGATLGVATDAADAVQRALSLAADTEAQSVVVIETLAKSNIKTKMRTSYKIAFAVLGALLLASIIFNIVLLSRTVSRTVVIQSEVNVDSLVEARLAQQPVPAVKDTTPAETPQVAEELAEEPAESTQPAEKAVEKSSTPAERITAIEDQVTSLTRTTDRSERAKIVEQATAEIDAVRATITGNAAAMAFLDKAKNYLAARKYTVDGNPTDTRAQVGAVNGQLRKARAAVE